MELIFFLPLALVLVQYLRPQKETEAPPPCPGRGCR